MNETPAISNDPLGGVDSNGLLADFVAAARKQERSIHSEFGGWGHAIWCNFQRDIGNGGRCNCGVSDMLTALVKYDSANAERSDGR